MQLKYGAVCKYLDSHMFFIVLASLHRVDFKLNDGSQVKMLTFSLKGGPIHTEWTAWEVNTLMF